MKAIVYREYGSPEVLRLQEIAKPEPGDDEVLIRVRAASVNPLDWHFMRGDPKIVRIAFGLTRPREPRLGRDVSGVVEAVGRSATRLKPGDEVFGAVRGAFGEHACGKERTLHCKPRNLSFEEAAALPIAGISALQALRDNGNLRAGDKVLVNGAAGGVGTFAVQIAKSFGAEVAGVCSSRNVELVSSLGALRVFDYTREDFTKSGAQFDVILDCVVNHSLSECARMLSSSGHYVMVGGPRGSFGPFLARMFSMSFRSMFGSRKFSTLMARITQQDLEVLRNLAEAGKLTPVIDRMYRLAETPEAVRYLEQGHARGKVVISID